MNSKTFTTSTTIAAIVSILLLMVVCCCMMGFAGFGLYTDQQRESVNQTTWIAVALFSCCGMSLPTIPLAIWGISYFIGRSEEREIEKSLAAIDLPNRRE